MVNPRKLKILLAASVIGLGTVSYIPHTYAESQTKVQTALEENLLSKLEMKGLQLDQAFSPDVKAYSVTVDNEVQEINLLLKSNHSGSQITVNGKPVGNGTYGTYSLKTGENIFIITVQDGTGASGTYKLTVTRKQNGNNLLKHIRLSNGVLSPSFSSSITSYNIEGLKDKTKLKLVPTAAVTTSTIKVNNKSVSNNGITVDIPAGESDIRITVTAENGKTKTYTLHVKRSASNDPSPAKSNPGTGATKKPAAGSSSGTGIANNQKGSQAVSGQKTTTGTTEQTTTSTEQKTTKAMLFSLSVSTGTWDSSFVKDEFTYHIAVTKGTKKVTISPVAAYSSSTIKIEGDTKKTIQLEADNKTVVSVVVKYSDDDRKTYVLVFDRKSS